MREGETIEETQTRIFASDTFRVMESKKDAWDKTLKALGKANEEVEKTKQALEKVATASETTTAALLLAGKDGTSGEEAEALKHHEEAIEKQQIAYAVCRAAEDEYLTAVAVKEEAFGEAIAVEKLYRRRVGDTSGTPRHGFLFATAA